jgi:hypothetical protein
MRGRRPEREWSRATFRPVDTVGHVRLRLLVLGLCCILATVLGGVAVIVDWKLGSSAARNGAPVAGFVPPYQEAEEAAWMRDQAFLVYQNYLRFGEGPAIAASQFEQPAHPNPDRVKVLVIGDSFIWGHGIVDTDMRWHDLLERELNTNTSPGTFEVVGMGSRGLSTLGQSQIFTAEMIDRLDPDVVVLGYGENDQIPRGDEAGICADGAATCGMLSLESLPEYVECVAGRKGGAPALVRKLVHPILPNLAAELARRACDNGETRTAEESPEYYFEILRKPTAGPYWSLFVEAAGTLRASIGERPAVVVPTLTDFIPAEETAAVLDVFEKAGWDVAPMPTTEKRTASVDDRSVLHVMPNVDRHPSAVLTTAYATDAAKSVLAALDPTKLELARASSAAPSATLVSNTMPITVGVSGDNGSRAVVSYTTPDASTVYPFAVGSGTALPPQYVPCIQMNRPYVQVMLDPTLPTGTNVKVALTTTEPVQISSYGYDSAGRIVQGPIRTLRPGDALSFSTSRAVSGLRFTNGGECRLDRPIDMTAFTVELTARRG